MGWGFELGKNAMANEIDLNRPNTLVPSSCLHEAVILCCGEDPDELMDVVQKLATEKLQQTHRYRCYQFWKYPRFALIWTGIGTGCMEPLLCEIFDTNAIQKIILIGTAGALSDDPEEFGRAFLIHKAIPGASALHLAQEQLPLTPNFQKLDQLGIEKRSTISTDYYYGFSSFPHPAAEKIKQSNSYLQNEFGQLWKTTDLIDMETAQFYYFCHTLRGDSLQYVAIRGAANTSQDYSEQTNHSKSVLMECMKQALKIISF